jgi:hypothetical protein
MTMRVAPRAAEHSKPVFFNDCETVQAFVNALIVDYLKI